MWVIPGFKKKNMWVNNYLYIYIISLYNIYIYSISIYGDFMGQIRLKSQLLIIGESSDPISEPRVRLVFERCSHLTESSASARWFTY